MPTEQANPKVLFYIVFVIGFIFAIVMVILFFNAAPARSNIEDHRKSEEAAACLKCHLIGDEKSPTMPTPQSWQMRSLSRISQGSALIRNMGLQAAP